MTISKENLIWIDLEMTGLDPNKNYIIEIATLVTDKNLKILEIGPSYPIQQTNKVLKLMDEWNKKTHTRSGLLKLVQESKYSINIVEKKTIEFLKKWVPFNTSPMCGNSISNDRFFLKKYMPKLFSYFHYRSIDVSSIKELARIWNPTILKTNKNNHHRALDDIYESIKELNFYRKYFINI